MTEDNGVTVNMDGAGDGETTARETLLNESGEGVTENAGTAGNSPSLPSADSPLSSEGAKAEAGAPEIYEAFTLPQGMDPQNEQVMAALDEAKGVFREMGLNQQQAQRLIDLHMKHYIGALAEDNERFERELDRRVAAWGKDVKADPDFGGARLDESLTAVKRAIANLGGEPLRHALSEETGLINHPQIFKAFARMGRYFTEDKLVTGANVKGVDDSPHGMAARVYPNMR